MRMTLPLEISGLGIVFFSPFAVAAIAEGEDFLRSEFETPESVADHVMRGDISAFCTGTGGTFELVVHDGDLDLAAVNAATFKVRLALEVRGGRVCFRDLYDLLKWTKTCPEGQTVLINDGFYRITVYSSAPPTGILGDNQRVYLHFEKMHEMPRLNWTGVPQLC